METLALIGLLLATAACDGNPTAGDGAEQKDAGGAAEAPPAPAPPPPLDPEEAARQDAEQRRQQLEAERAAAEAEERARIEAERLAFERAYPKHGVVYHYVAQVFREPNDRGNPLGYMRRGAQFRAKNGVHGAGCAGLWHEVPGGGFVCAGAGFLIGDSPQTFEPSPVPPAVDDALPYAYAYTMRDGVPQYWELPDLEMETQAEAVIREIRSLERQAVRAAEAAAAEPETAAEPTDADDEGGESDEADEGEASATVDAVEAGPPPGLEEEAGTAEEEGPTEEEGVTLPSFLRSRMRQGYYVSLDRRFSTPIGRLFDRTVRGGYVRTSELTPNEPPESRGVVLGGDWELPLAIVFRRGVQQYRRPASGRLREHGRIDRHTPLRLSRDDLVVDGRRYVLAANGIIVREPSVRILRQRERPSGVPEGAKWIHVDLSQQSLTAYEGDRPVFATLVSTGKEGHETPTGLFRIQSKHVSTTMDNEESPEGAYSIEDVPWTMYFHGNYALHGAFWHYTFGRVRSHGCVNLSPVDARWLFQWSTPTLPAPWHGMFADTRRHAGTFVFIEE